MSLKYSAHSYFRSVLVEQLGHLQAAPPARNQQQTMQPMIVTGLVAAGDLLLDGDTHHFTVGNFQFAHDGVSSPRNRRLYRPLTWHYLRRYV